MNYHKDSFLAGLAVGRQLKGWASGGGGGGELPWMLDAGLLWDLMPIIYEIEEGS